MTKEAEENMVAINQSLIKENMELRARLQNNNKNLLDLIDAVDRAKAILNRS